MAGPESGGAFGAAGAAAAAGAGSSAGASVAAADGRRRESTFLTIYQDGSTIAHKYLTLDIPRANAPVDVYVRAGAGRLDATTVVLRALTASVRLQVLQQEFMGLGDEPQAGPRDTLTAYCGSEVTLTLKSGKSLRGTLLSVDATSVSVATGAEGTVTVTRRLVESCASNAELPLTPSFFFKLQCSVAGPVECELVYQADVVVSRRHYTCVLAPDHKSMVFAGRVTLCNRIGLECSDARIRLVTIERYVLTGDDDYLSGSKMSGLLKSGKPRKADWPSSYTFDLPELVQFHPGRDVQAELFTVPVPVRQLLMVQGSPARRNADGAIETDKEFAAGQTLTGLQTVLEMPNTSDVGLGRMMLSGTVRFFERDAEEGSGLLSCIGDGQMQATQPNHVIRLVLNYLPGVTAARRQVAYSFEKSRRVIRETFEIVLTNDTERDLAIEVEELLQRGSRWEVTQASHEYARFPELDRVQFRAVCPRRDAATVTYTVLYTF